MLFKSELTCPKCNFLYQEVMLENVCQTYYRCPHCRAQIKAKEGECCVFCSYGDTPCPNAQFVGSSCCGRD